MTAPQRLSTTFIGAITWDLVGRLAGLASGAVASILLVRTLGIERYGVLGVLVSVQAVVTALASFGYAYHVPRLVRAAFVRGEWPAARAALRRMVTRRFLCLLVVSTALITAPGSIGALIGRPEVVPYLPWLVLVMIGPFFRDLVAGVLAARFEQGYANVVHALVRLAYLAGLGLALAAGGGVRAALVVLGAASLIELALLAARLGRADVAVSAGDEREPAPAAGVWLFAFGVLALVLGRELDVLLLARLGPGTGEITRYVVTFNFVNTYCLAFVLALSGRADLAMVAELHARRDREGLQRLFTGMVEFVYLFLLPIAAGGALLGIDVIAVLYGDALADTGPLLVGWFLVAVPGYFVLVSTPFLMGLGRERSLVGIRLTAAAVNVLLAVVLVPRLGALGAVAATGTTWCLHAALEAVLLHRTAGLVWPGRFLRAALIGTAAMTATLGLVLAALPGGVPLARLAVGLPLGAVVYLVAIRSLHAVSSENLAALARSPMPGSRLVARALGLGS